MKEKEIRVLQINAENFGAGGISVIIWRLMKKLESNKVHMSFLSQRENTDEKYVNEIYAQGGKIHYIKITTNKVLRYFDRYWKCCEVIKNNDYDIVHINGNESFGIISYVLAAKRKSNCKVVVHAHSTRFMNEDYIIIKNFFKDIFLPLLIRSTDSMLACSSEAARFMYGKKSNEAIIVKNGLEPAKYVFDDAARNQLRNEMQANNKMIIGHIGRFVYPKNHEFIIDVFEQLSKEYSNVELWLIGEKQGEGYEKIYNRIMKKNLQGRIKMIGSTDKIKEYLSAMDVLFFPSRFEGLPLVLVEAQINGLPVVCSDVITDEAFFAENVEKLSLDTSLKEWIDKLIQFGKEERKALSYHEIEECGFEISKIADVVFQEYKKLMVRLE